MSTPLQNETAYVEWVDIKRIITSGGTAYLELDNGIIKGALGGGVFGNGRHIGFYLAAQMFLVMGI